MKKYAGSGTWLIKSVLEVVDISVEKYMIKMC